MKPWAVALSAIVAGVAALLYARRAAAAPTPRQTIPSQPPPPPAPVPPPNVPMPTPKPQPAATVPTVTSDDTINEATYSTPPGDAVLPDAGWVDFNGTQITPIPLTDKRTGLFARLKHRDALAAAAALGGELLAEKDFIALHAAAKRGEALELAPVTLVNSAADSQRMASLEFAKKHDAKVHAQLEALHWDGHTPVSNIGKYWLEDGANFGWYSPNAKSRDSAGNPIIQSIGHAHVLNGRNDHIDYSQVTMLKRGAR